MKKILCLTSVAMVLLLAACGGGGGTEETVCRVDDNFFGGTMIATFESTDNEITSATLEIQIDISDMSEEEVQDLIEIETAGEDDVDYQINGDTLSISQTVEGEDLEAQGMSRDLEELIAQMEENDAVCN